MSNQLACVLFFITLVGKIEGNQRGGYKQDVKNDNGQSKFVDPDGDVDFFNIFADPDTTCKVFQSIRYLKFRPQELMAYLSTDACVQKTKVFFPPEMTEYIRLILQQPNHSKTEMKKLYQLENMIMNTLTAQREMDIVYTINNQQSRNISLCPSIDESNEAQRYEMLAPKTRERRQANQDPRLNSRTRPPAVQTESESTTSIMATVEDSDNVTADYTNVFKSDETVVPPFLQTAASTASPKTTEKKEDRTDRYGTTALSESLGSTSVSESEKATENSFSTSFDSADETSAASDSSLDRERGTTEYNSSLDHESATTESTSNSALGRERETNESSSNSAFDHERGTTESSSNSLLDHGREATESSSNSSLDQERESTESSSDSSLDHERVTTESSYRRETTSSSFASSRSERDSTEFLNGTPDMTVEATDSPVTKSEIEIPTTDHSGLIELSTDMLLTTTEVAREVTTGSLPQSCTLIKDQGIRTITVDECTEGSNLTLYANQTGEGGFVRVGFADCCVMYCHHRTIIQAPVGKEIIVKFTSVYVLGPFQVSSGGVKNCLSEKVALMILKNDTEIVTTQLCGYRPPSQSIRMRNNKIAIDLIVKDNVECGVELLGNYVAYKASYLVCDPLDSTNTLEVCGRLHQHPMPSLSKSESDNMTIDDSDLTSNLSGRITSPGYLDGQDYPDFFSCVWEITVPAGNRIKLWFEYISVQAGSSGQDICDKDHVTIRTYAETSGQAFPEVLTFCGRSIPRTFVSPTERLTIEFHSNENIVSRGFELKYQEVKSSEFFPWTSSDLLDCSNLIPHYVMCDVTIDCVGGEDENVTNCPSVKECQDTGGWSNYGAVRQTSCYWVMYPSRQVSWYEAMNYCRTNNKGNLISFNTRGEVRMMEKYLKSWHPNLDPQEGFYLGLRRMRSANGRMYRRLWEWADGTSAFDHLDEFQIDQIGGCTLWLRGGTNDVYRGIDCTTVSASYFICERSIEPDATLLSVTWPSVKWEDRKSTYHCKNGEYIDKVFYCNGWDDCTDASDERNCKPPIDDAVFHCGTNIKVPFSQVCDGVDNCLDGSDESFCSETTRMVLPANLTKCRNGYRIPSENWCDGKEHCLDGSDEMGCEECRGDTVWCPTFGCIPVTWTREPDNELDCPVTNENFWRYVDEYFTSGQGQSVSPPGVVIPDGYGKAQIRPLVYNESCPVTHFACADGFCIPIYMLCNGIKDCPLGEDEGDGLCETGCPNMYKCRSSKVCLHSSQVCDGQYDCPYHDDEFLCTVDLNCPSNCTCVRYEFTCQGLPEVSEEFYRMRSLDLSQNNLSTTDLDPLHGYNLALLNLSYSNLEHLTPERLEFVNLITLDLSHNQITGLDRDAFLQCRHLANLHLQNNSLSDLDTYQFLHPLTHLQYLDLSHNLKATLTSGQFMTLSELVMLKVSDMKMSKIESGAFSGLRSLRTLDLRGNHLTTFKADVLTPLLFVDTLLAENYKLCCGGVAPKFLLTGTCVTPPIPIADCENLLGQVFTRVSTWAMSAISVIGHTIILVCRVMTRNNQDAPRGHAVILTAFTFPGLAMGVYLGIIGAADEFYKDDYIWHEDDWRKSGLCTLAGWIFMTSLEMSVLLSLLLTVDRIGVILFQFKLPSMMPLGARRCLGGVAILGVVIGTALMLSSYGDLESGQETSACVPLPLSSSDGFFALFIVLNFILVLTILIGQLAIYLRVQNYKKAEFNVLDTDEIATAKGHGVVVSFTAAIWFVVGITGIMSKLGIDVPLRYEEIIATLLLPLPSAIFPFLYLVHCKIQSRHHVRERKKTIGSGKTSSISSNPSSQLTSWLENGSVTSDMVLKLLAKTTQEG